MLLLCSTSPCSSMKRWHFQHRRSVSDSSNSASLTVLVQSGIVKFRNKVRHGMWLMKRRSSDYKSLSSFTWKCPTKLFLDPCEMFDKSGNKVWFVQLLRSPDDDACQQVFVGPLLCAEEHDGRGCLMLEESKSSPVRSHPLAQCGQKTSPTGKVKLFLGPLCFLSGCVPWVFSLPGPCVAWLSLLLSGGPRRSWACRVFLSRGLVLLCLRDV